MNPFLLYNQGKQKQEQKGNKIRYMSLTIIILKTLNLGTQHIIESRSSTDKFDADQILPQRIL